MAGNCLNEFRGTPTNVGMPGVWMTATHSQHMICAGVLALWKGVMPAMARGLTYGGLRIGLYTPIKDMIAGGESLSLQSKLAAGCLSGGLAAAMTNPIELVCT